MPQSKQESTDTLPYETWKPDLPPQVNPAHIKENGRLLSDDDIKEAERQLGDNPVKKIKRNKNKEDFSVLRLYTSIEQDQNGQNYAKTEDFILYRGKEKRIGKGAYADVKLAQRVSDGKWFSLKRIYEDEDEDAGAFNVTGKYNTERRGIKAANVEGQYQVEFAQGMPKEAPLNNQKAYVATEYRSGIPVNKLDKNKLSPKEQAKVARSMLDEASDFYQAQRLHLDIKPENMVYNPDSGEVKYIDFAFTTSKEAGKEGKGTGAGSGEYLAPEVKLQIYYNYFGGEAKWQKEIEDEANQRGVTIRTDTSGAGNAQPIIRNEKTEVYALGISLARFFGADERKIIPRADGSEEYRILIKDAEKVKNASLPNDAKKEIIDYLKAMTDNNPDNRPTLEEAKTFFKNVEKQLVQSADNLKRVAIIDVNDLLKQDSKGNYKINNAGIKALKSSDEVVIYDSKNILEKKFSGSELFAQLHSNGINPKEILTGEHIPEQIDQQGVVSYLEKKSGEGANSNFYYKAEKGKLIKINSTATQTSFHNFVSSLLDERSKLQTQRSKLSKLPSFISTPLTKLTDGKIKALGEALKKVQDQYAKGELTHDKAKDALKGLETDFSEARKSSGFGIFTKGQDSKRLEALEKTAQQEPPPSSPSPSR